MSRHKHPQSRSNRESKWDKGNGYLRSSCPQTPGERVSWQDRHGKHVGVLVSTCWENNGFFKVLEDGQADSVLVGYARKEKEIIGSIEGGNKLFSLTLK